VGIVPRESVRSIRRENQIVSKPSRFFCDNDPHGTWVLEPVLVLLLVEADLFQQDRLVVGFLEMLRFRIPCQRRSLRVVVHRAGRALQVGG
jgi:hypothetical protein